jgi:hypothetical protein
MIHGKNVSYWFSNNKMSEIFNLAVYILISQQFYEFSYIIKSTTTNKGIIFIYYLNTIENLYMFIRIKDTKFTLAFYNTFYALK